MTEQNEIVLYRPDETMSLEVKLDVERDTVWLSTAQMAELFHRDDSNIRHHINNIFKEGELPKNNNVNFLHVNGVKKPVPFYTLDVIISVGYRVKSLQGTAFRQWANKVLKDYLLRGYAMNERLLMMKEEIDYKLAKHEIVLQEHQKQIDFFVKAELPPHQGVFMDGQIYDAFEFATRLIKSAKNKIVLIDNYVDETTLLMLGNRYPGVVVNVVTRRKSEQLALAEDKFNEQYGGLVITTSDKVHDRFLILDDEHLYLIGASLKDLGKRLFAFIEMDSEYIEELSNRFTAN